MSLKSEMNALADQVRRLCGKTGTMTITAMTNNLKGVNAGGDSSGATATSPDVVSGKTFIGANGSLETGSMTNNGAVNKTLDTSTKTYNIPAGYHNGSGKVQIETQTKSVTPTASAQTIYPDSGKVLSAVTVAAAGGRNVYSGSITINSISQTSLTINTDVSLSASDTFILYYSGSGYDGYNADGMRSENFEFISNAYKTPTDSAVVVGSSSLTDNEGSIENAINVFRDGTISFSGKQVSITSSHPFAPSGSSTNRTPAYSWILIK